MVGWQHQLSGHELKQTPGDGEGQEMVKGREAWRSAVHEVTKTRLSG